MLTPLVVCETLLLVVLTFLVAGLLRSHAEILRRIGPPDDEGGDEETLRLRRHAPARRENELTAADVRLRAEASVVLYLVSPDYAVRAGETREFALDLGEAKAAGCDPSGLLANTVSDKTGKLLGVDPVDVQKNK